MARQAKSKAGAAFEQYLALGPSRTLEQLAQTATVSLPTLKTWSRTNGWFERAKDYDTAQRERERADRERLEAEDRERRHKRRLADLDKLRPLVEEAFGYAEAIRLLKDPKDLVRVLEFMHKEERLEMGEPTDRQEMAMSGDQVIRVEYADTGAAAPPSRPASGDSGEPAV